MSSSENQLTIDDLETVYDALAQAIDIAGADKTPLFLVKLALLNANALGQAQPFLAHVKIALQDL
jgi:N-glycosylase/DNA lyase